MARQRGSQTPEAVTSRHRHLLVSPAEGLALLLSWQPQEGLTGHGRDCTFWRAATKVGTQVTAQLVPGSPFFTSSERSPLKGINRPHRWLVLRDSPLFREPRWGGYVLGKNCPLHIFMSVGHVTRDPSAANPT